MACNLALKVDMAPEKGKMDKDDLIDIVCIDVKKLLIKIPS